LEMSSGGAWFAPSKAVSVTQSLSACVTGADAPERKG